MNIVLIYLSSESIVSFLAEHPLPAETWTPRIRQLTGRNGPGDLRTPTPAMGLFFGLLEMGDGRLFDAKTYADFATSHDDWAGWFSGLDDEQQEGVWWRCQRNFYVSAVDSLHVWALLVETGCFHRCVVSTVEDVVGKTDLMIWRKRESRPIAIALKSTAPSGFYASDYKELQRGAPPKDTIVINMDMSRPRSPGNKRWHTADYLMLKLGIDTAGGVR